MRALSWLVLLGMIAGCGGSEGGRVPVTGTVTMDGVPVEGLNVMFLPDRGSPGQGGYGRTGPDGHYEIAYPYTGKGLVPGNYVVTINPLPTGEGGKDLIDAPVRGGGVWGKYANLKTTPLRATVEPGGKPIDWRLTSDAKK